MWHPGHLSIRDHSGVLLQHAPIWYFSISFFSFIWGTCVVVTPDIVSEVLHVPRVAHPDYLDCDRLKTEKPSSWGDRQKTPCSSFAKVPRFLNMVMTFILHPLSHYNSIIEPRAWFLLSLLKDISIDFPSHFILSLIDVYRDMATRDKLIFPSEASSSFFCLLSQASSFYSYECHKHCYHEIERGLTSTRAALDWDDNSSSFCCSIHLRSFVFYGWRDSRDHYVTACLHGCSPWHTQW